MKFFTQKVNLPLAWDVVCLQKLDKDLLIKSKFKSTFVFECQLKARSSFKIKSKKIRDSQTFRAIVQGHLLDFVMSKSVPMFRKRTKMCICQLLRIVLTVNFFGFTLL